MFATTNIALFTVTPPEVAGTVGAIFACSLQLGSVAGAAIITSVQTSVEKTHGGPNSYDDRAAGFWFLFAFTVVKTMAVAVFMRNTVSPVRKDVEQIHGTGLSKDNDASTVSPKADE